jgi:methionine sulfoxide reductase heme-binding subunit
MPLVAGALAGTGAVTLAVVVGRDASESALLAARWTARTAFPLFLIVYLTSSLYKLNQTDWTHSLLRNRRQWGLGFAIAGTIHLAALGINISLFRPRPLETLVPGAIIYALLYAMVATSTTSAQQRLGPKWKLLHRIALHGLWATFLAGYAGRITHAEAHYHDEGWIGASLALLAAAIRLYAKFGKSESTAN